MRAGRTQEGTWEYLLSIGSVDTIDANDVVQACSLAINNPLIPETGSRDRPQNQLPASVIRKTIFADDQPQGTAAIHGFEWTSQGSNRKKFGCSLNALAYRIRPEQFLKHDFQAQSDLDAFGLDHDTIDNGLDRHHSRAEALLMLGDNWYGALDGGAHSPRWHTQFEQMYPTDTFDCPVYAILGNHDYQRWPDSKVDTELQYARVGKTRWTMPARWYRFELPAAFAKTPDGKMTITS